MPPENKTAAVRCRCTIIVLHKTLSIINTTLNTTYYVHFSWKQRQIHKSRRWSHCLCFSEPWMQTEQ